MKKILKAVIIVGIVILIILFKDSILNKNSSNKSKEDNLKNEQNKVSDYTRKIFTPGPLKISEEFLNKDNKEYSEIKTASIIKLTNEERAKNGNLPTLTENADLDQSTKEKVEDMFSKQYFEHISPDKIGVGNLAQKNGYDYIIIGENLALGDFKSEKDLIDTWMNSKGHRANILNNKYLQIGVYVQKGTFKGEKVWIAVQHFGLPLSACPQIDGNLKTSIEINQNKADELSDNLTVLKQDLDKNFLLMYIYGSKKQEKAVEYNSMAEEYNSLIKETKMQIDQYNEQVKMLNDCIQNELSPN